MKSKKILALILSLLMLGVPLVSCTNTEDPDTNDVPSGEETANSGESVEKTQLLTHIFRGESISLPEDYSLREGVTPLYDKDSGNITCFCTCTVQVTEGEVNSRAAAEISYVQENHLVTLSSDGTVLEDRKLEIEGDENAYIDQGAFSGDFFYYLSSTYDEASEKDSFTVVKVSLTDGTAVRSDELTALFTAQDDSRPWFYINAMTVDSEGYVYLLADNEILVTDSNFIKQFSVFAESWFQGLYLSADGSVYTQGRFDNVTGLCTIDKQTKALGPVIELGGNSTMDSIYFGEGYDLYYTDDEGLFGFTLADGVSELVMNYQNSDLTSGDVSIMKVFDKESFLGSSRDPETYQDMLMIYRKADDVDLSSLKIIEIATAEQLWYDVPDKIVEFNKAHPDSRIIVNDYSKYRTSEDYEAGTKKLTTDIMNGLYEPDIVIGSSYYSPITQIVEHDLYTDLYTFIDNDDSISRDDIFGAVTNLFDDEGKLWGLTNSFYVRSLIGPKSVLGERESWTFSEMIDFAAGLPDGVELVADLTQSGAVGTIFGDLGYGAFIDEETNTAHFDSDEFIKFLEYIGTLPASIDYNALPEDYHETKYLRRLNGEIALHSTTIDGTFTWLQLQVFFNTEDYTIIGYPTADSENGSYATTGDAYVITSYCDYPEEAWEFVKSICAPELTARDISRMSGIGDGFPILKSSFDRVAENDYNMQYRFRLDGSGGGYGTYDPENPKTEADYDYPIMFDFYTEEDHAELKEFLDTKVGTRDLGSISDEITAIVNEEISSFTSGIRDAKSTADIIQSRVSIWLAEHE